VRQLRHVAQQLAASQLEIAELARKLASLQKPLPSPLLDYKADVFDGIRWRWRYDYDRLDMASHMKAYCPECDNEIIPKQRGAATMLDCHECQKNLATLWHQDSNLYARVKSQIERQLRRKGWKQ
jgi:hypothetical protein